MVQDTPQGIMMINVLDIDISRTLPSDWGEWVEELWTGLNDNGGKSAHLKNEHQRKVTQLCASLDP